MEAIIISYSALVERNGDLPLGAHIADGVMVLDPSLARAFY